MIPVSAPEPIQSTCKRCGRLRDCYAGDVRGHAAGFECRNDQCPGAYLKHVVGRDGSERLAAVHTLPRERRAARYARRNAIRWGIRNTVRVRGGTPYAGGGA